MHNLQWAREPFFQEYGPPIWKQGPLSKTITRMAAINRILARYRTMTMRQVFYQFVASGSDLFAWNHRGYNALKTTMKNGRRAGIIPWNIVIDMTRNLRKLPHWADSDQFLHEVVPQYAHDKWADQPMRVELWIEKDSLVGIVNETCVALQVPLMSCRGNISDPEVWSAAHDRFAAYEAAGQEVVVLHMADHDPGGVDMTRDLKNKLNNIFGSLATVTRIGLNLDQIRAGGYPSSFAKETDSKLKAYEAQFGFRTCWELDAMPADEMADLVEQRVLELRDDDEWQESVKRETESRHELEIRVNI